jgi:hypothetical protein
MVRNETFLNGLLSDLFNLFGLYSPPLAALKTGKTQEVIPRPLAAGWFIELYFPQ